MPTKSASIADRINERMEALGLTNEDVASRCRVSVQSVVNWRRDAERIYSFRLPALARALKCSVIYLLGLSDRIGSA